MGIFQEPLVEHRALYYPLTYPPDWWLKQTLLFHESFSTLAADPEAADGESSTRTIETRTMFDWLGSEGLWIPIPEAPKRTDLYTREFERMFKARLFLTQSELVGHGQLADLIHEGAAAITARLLAEERTDSKLKLLPQTDRPSGLAFAYEGTSRSDEHRCRELIVQGLLPVPAEEVPLEAVLDFRARYRDELLEFRIELDQLIDNVASSPDPLDAIHTARQSVEHSARKIERAARGRRLRLTAATSTVVAVNAAAAATLKPETVRWVFDGFGVAAGVALTTRIVRGPATEHSPYGYLIRAHKEYG